MNIVEAYAKLDELIQTLTGPDGCPWDKEQSPESLADYLVEECNELADALRSGKAIDIVEEMGDVMFLLAFVSHLCKERSMGSLSDAMECVTAKMTRRHPHVFGDTQFADQTEQLKYWEQIKREEKAASPEPKGLFSGLPRRLPALIKAYRLHSKAARVGFTWADDEDVERQVEAEWLELLDALGSGDKKAQEHELGDMIFTLVELGRRKGLRANAALDYATRRFLDRFERMEALARVRGLDFTALPLDDKDELWNEIKAEDAGIPLEHTKA